MPHISFAPFPNLISQRLSLRQLTASDAYGLFLLRADKQVAEFVHRPIATSVDEIHPFIDKLNSGVAHNEWIFWAITLKADTKLIGTICLWNITTDGSKAEIGYELLPRYQGKGFMQEAVTAVLAYGFEHLKLDVIEAVVHPDNMKSLKLLQRNNFVLEGTLEEADVEMVIYTLKNEAS